MHTHYDLLGVPPSAGYPQIHRAYQGLCIALDPGDDADAPARAEATALFLRVRAAFEALSDPTRREAYDNSILHARRTSPS